MRPAAGPVPTGGGLEGVTSAGENVFGEVSADQLHASRHPRCVEAIRQCQGRTAAEVERRGEAQDIQKHIRILAIGLHQIETGTEPALSE